MTKYDALSLAIQAMEQFPDEKLNEAINVILKMQEGLLKESRKKRQYYAEKTSREHTEETGEFIRHWESAGLI